MQSFKTVRPRPVKGKKQEKLLVNDNKSQKPSLLFLLSSAMNFVGGVGKCLNFIDKMIDKFNEHF